MIQATYVLDWKGEPYKRKLLRELQRATRQGAERVQRNAKEVQLNTSGYSETTKAGLNKKKIAARMAMKSSIAGLKTVTSKRTGATLTFGGSYKGLDRIYWNADVKRWVQSSPPGSPPHKQRGTLQRLIAVEMESHGMKAKIGPSQRLIYGRIQELGGRGLIRLPPRPYMRPALLAESQRVLFGFQLAVARASQ